MNSTKICMSCDIEHCLSEILQIDNRTYCCLDCYKGRKQQKTIDWTDFFSENMVIINDKLLELQDINVLDKAVMVQKIREITDKLLELKYFTESNEDYVPPVVDIVV